MNAGDQAIEEIRAVRCRISAEHGHDVARYIADLRAEEKQHAVQLKRGARLLSRRNAERRKYPAPLARTMALRERPKRSS